MQNSSENEHSGLCQDGTDGDPFLHDAVTGTSYCQSGEVRVYKRCWYILMLYCCLASFNSIIWNTWGPIQATARAVYGWEGYVVDLMPAWGDIVFCLTIAPFSWIMDVKGLRLSVLLAAGCELCGAALRCLPIQDSKTSTVLISCAQIIAGLAGPVCMAAPTLLSSTWFPPHQRTTATAISTMAGYAGTALSFLIGPAFVDDVEKSGLPKNGDVYVLNSTQKAKYKTQINRLLYVEAGVVLALFLAVLAYYPTKPPKPPSLSAGTGRVDFKTGLKKLFKNYNFLLLVLLYGASTGVYGGWLAVLDQNLSELDLEVSQDLAGWLGFVATIGGSISGILFSLFADHFSRHLKLFLIVFMALSCYTILLICYVFTGLIPFNEVAVYVLFTLSGFFVNGSIPFFFELAVEISYPVAEGVTTGVATFTNNFLQSVFLVVPLAHLGSSWMIWATVATCAVSTVLMLFVRETYNRSAVDRQTPGEPSRVSASVNT